MASLASGNAKNCSCMSSQKWFFLLFVFIGFILMTATGLIVYYNFCIPTGVETEFTCSPTPAPATNCPALPSNLPACTSPPTCPPIAALPCPNSPAQTCRRCPAHPPCTDSNCRPFVCQAELKPLTTSEITDKRALELLTKFPPNSYERLQVALQLMEFIEWWANAFTVRGCVNSVQRVCTICNDRYKYLRCIVENDLDSNIETPKTTSFEDDHYVNEPSNNLNRVYALRDRGGRGHWFPEDIRRRAFHSAKHGQFVKYNESNKELWKWGLRFEDYIPLQINQRALTFWIDKAGNPHRRHCTPCEGLNPLNHINCTAFPFE